MLTVVLNNRSTNEIMDIVQDLRKQGLVQGTDFDFAYNPPKWDGFTQAQEKFTVFNFYVEKYATLFSLKYI
jgi:hypothetical protein